MGSEMCIRDRCELTEEANSGRPPPCRLSLRAAPAPCSSWTRPPHPAWLATPRTMSKALRSASCILLGSPALFKMEGRILPGLSPPSTLGAGAGCCMAEPVPVKVEFGCDRRRCYTLVLPRVLPRRFPCSPTHALVLVLCVPVWVCTEEDWSCCLATKRNSTSHSRHRSRAQLCPSAMCSYTSRCAAQGCRSGLHDRCAFCFCARGTVHVGGVCWADCSAEPCRRST